MSERELVVLGTASQAPTRRRNHNGYLLRWDAEGVLFDPGEGTQRQLIHAGVASSAITRICITHFHGDHCLGLPGVMLRMALDRVAAPVPVYFPAAGAHYYERLRHASASSGALPVRARPCEPGVVEEGPAFRLIARALRHRVETLGWRLEEPDGRRMLPEALARAEVAGPDIGRLQRAGVLDVAGRRVHLTDVSAPRPGQVAAFIMDTGLCDAAFALAEGADLLVCEATYLSDEAALAAEHGHLTAAQAGRIAEEAGARTLVLAHFSGRYTDTRSFVEEAGSVFGGAVVAAEDFDRIPVPERR